VVLLSSEHETGAKNERHLVAVSCAKESGFEVVHGLLNRVMEVLGVPYKGGWPLCWRLLAPAQPGRRGQ
jgi:phenylalanyl-tRNA synthetase beta chain